MFWVFNQKTNNSSVEYVQQGVEVKLAYQNIFKNRMRLQDYLFTMKK